MGKILVLGGAGYIGSQTNLELLDQGFETVVFDNLEFGHKYTLDDRSSFVEGNILNYTDLEKVFKEYDIDGVIHFAAYLSVAESVKEPYKYYNNNVVGTLNVLRAMINHKVKNIVFSSTAATYGLVDKDIITEETDKKPINPYGHSKLMVEQILKDFHHAYGINSICLRYFNASGADKNLRTGEDHNPETHLIPLVLQAARGVRPNIKQFGDDYNTKDGSCIRDYIHTMDLATAHIKAIQKLINEELECEQINLGTGKGVSVKEIFETAKKITGVDFEIVVENRREGDPDCLVASNQKAKDLLGWEPKHSDITNIIKTAWAWECNRKSD